VYVWIWRHLPGPTTVRILQVLVLFLLFVALLFFVVFPWLEPYLPFDRVTSGAPAAISVTNPACPGWPVCDP
jgi:hypothetical protein